jgi:hypothetical protein
LKVENICRILFEIVGKCQRLAVSHRRLTIRQRSTALLYPLFVNVGSLPS